MGVVLPACLTLGRVWLWQRQLRLRPQGYCASLLVPVHHCSTGRNSSGSACEKRGATGAAPSWLCPALPQYSYSSDAVREPEPGSAWLGPYFSPMLLECPCLLVLLGSFLSFCCRCRFKFWVIWWFQFDNRSKVICGITWGYLACVSWIVCIDVAWSLCDKRQQAGWIIELWLIWIVHSTRLIF